MFYILVDHTRVKLTDTADPALDYINANFIEASVCISQLVINNVLITPNIEIKSAYL